MDRGPQDRVISVDIFRGLTIASMILVNNPGSWRYVYGPLRHAGWHGWTFADTVFPFFLFIVGISIALSLGRRLEGGEVKRSLYIKIIRRSIILFALGLLLGGFPHYDLSTLRIPGVLQRISVCYLAASVIFLNSRWKGQLAWALALLIIYWAAMEWIPVPEAGPGAYEKGSSLAAWVDGLLLEGHMWRQTGTWDPEGVLSTVPAVSSTLFGSLAGLLLRGEAAPRLRTAGLLAAGAAAILLGSLWNHVMPINKSLWTGSYAVLMAGLASICLAVIYYIADVRGWKSWAQPARVIGGSAIAAYVLAGIAARMLLMIRIGGAGGNAVTAKSWIYENLFASWLGDAGGSLAYSIAYIAAIYLCMLPLYSKRIFIRI
jgi:predicted acyltransferase